MGKVACLSVLIITGWLNVCAEDLPKKAAENPLDFALHLAIKEKDARRGEGLAGALFDVGRYDDAARAIELDDRNMPK